MIDVSYERTIPLWHSGECHLLGITPPPHRIYVEEVYGVDNWVAQYAFERDGTLIAAVDEARGENPEVTALPLPDQLKRPSSGWISMGLNSGGVPDRGLIETDRVIELVRPLRTMDKEMLIASGHLPEMPLPDILGLAGSFVISEAKLARKLYLLVRQLRVAVRLDEAATTEDGSMYDYITYSIPILQAYYPGDPDLALHDTMLANTALGVTITCPTDVIAREDLLAVADAGAGHAERTSEVHLWRIEPEQTPSDQERLYG